MEAELKNNINVVLLQIFMFQNMADEDGNKIELEGQILSILETYRKKAIEERDSNNEIDLLDTIEEGKNIISLMKEHFYID